MSFVDGFLNMMRLNDDGDDDDYDFDNDDFLDEEDEEEEPIFKKKIFHKEKKEEAYSEPQVVKEKPVKTANPKITPIAKNTRKQVTGMEVCVIKPKAFEDAKEITETLLSNRTVVLNVEGLDLQIAQRIIDFASGSCFAINGNLQKISNYIFIMTPQSVDISGDIQNIIDAFDFPSPTI